MTLAELHPYVRYVRQVRTLREDRYEASLPFDARLFYTLRGTGRVLADGNEYTLPPGSLLYINAGVAYQLLGGEADYIAVNFDLTHRHSHRTLPIPPERVGCARFMPLEAVRFAEAPALDRCWYCPSCPQAGETMAALLAEYERRLPDSEPYATALLTGLLIQMLRHEPEPAARLQPELVVDYIRRHYREELTGEVLAGVFHYHPNHISAVIRRHTGLPLHRYLLETRIRHALPLLEEGRLSVAQVAHAVGFADANYFTRYFKQVMGITPLTYRNQGGIPYEDRFF